MNKIFIVNFVNILTNILMILIFARVILSWVPSGFPRVRKFLFDVTEPLLAPIRKIIPPIGGVMDLSPIIAYLLLYLIQIGISYI
ncbi:MAG: YggT family protein [Patescibacteria group bacterium]|nr:YggT family protein [Patescibacteria group bacterium]